MSLPYKLIIPLLDDTITEQDLSKDNGFINVYNEDINRPYLDNHIFLLYRYYNNEKEVARDEKFRKSPCLYNSDIIKINNKLYLLYSFSIVNKTIRNIMNNSFIIPKEDKIKICKFWNFKDKDVIDYIFGYSKNVLFKDSKVPEVDWKPDITDLFKKKSNLVIAKAT